MICRTQVVVSPCSFVTHKGCISGTVCSWKLFLCEIIVSQTVVIIPRAVVSLRSTHGDRSRIIMQILRTFALRILRMGLGRSPFVSHLRKFWKLLVYLDCLTSLRIKRKILPSISPSGFSEVLSLLSALLAAWVFNLCSSHLSVMTIYAKPITTGNYIGTETN